MVFKDLRFMSESMVLMLEDTSGRAVLLGSVYAALERLENKGLVASSIGAPTAERGGRAKKYFKATTKGVRDTREACRTFARLWRGVPALSGELA